MALLQSAKVRGKQKPQNETFFKKAEKRTKKRKTHLNEAQIEFNALPVAATTAAAAEEADQDRLGAPSLKRLWLRRKKKNGKTKKTRKIKNEKEKKTIIGVSSES